jgi:hypothetical protein
MRYVLVAVFTAYGLITPIGLLFPAWAQVRFTSWALFFFSTLAYCAITVVTWPSPDKLALFDATTMGGSVNHRSSTGAYVPVALGGADEHL